MRKLIFGIMLILIVAAITKPSKENFSSYINSELKVDNNDGLMSSLMKIGMNFQSDLTTQYHDKVFYSTADTYLGNENHTYLGLFGFWIKLK